MTPIRPRLVLVRGVSPLPADCLESLKSAFDVVEVENIGAARAALENGSDGVILAGPSEADALSPHAPSGTEAVLEHLGEGVGVVGTRGDLAWADRRLRSSDEALRTKFIDRCLQALELFNKRRGDAPREGRQSRRLSFSTDANHYEMVVSPTALGDDGSVQAVVGVVWDVTSSRSLQASIDAIDAAGSELMQIEASSIAHLNMAERLNLLEPKIVHYVHDLLQFDNFEIRLLDRESNQLELVMAVGISPLKIGEVIYAELESNGISGYVAATGRSMICRDVQAEPLYREGLDNAASSLTVPLRLHDQIIGVFNIESNTPSAFTEHDRQFAEIFGRYIAMATNILDLLVVERYTTNEQVTENVLSELGEPLGDITAEAVSLMGGGHDEPEAKERLERIIDAATAIRRRIESCAAGPRTIIGAEQELHRHEIDPKMAGRRVLIADNEPVIRDTLHRILTQRGCDVTVGKDGLETIAALEASAKTGRSYELVISDIKMPDRTGYEVFRTAKSINPDTAVILMTGFGYDPHHSIVRASQEGLHSFLFKPYKASQLIEAVTKAFVGNPAAAQPARSATTTRQSPS